MTKTTQVIEDGFDVTGRVVGTETSYYDGLTDHFAIVWNPETLTCTAHTIYSTSKVQIDGPTLVVAFYKIAKAHEAATWAENREKARKESEALAELTTIRTGKTVTVVRGRKVPRGTTGRVFWFGETKFGWSVGIELANGNRVFTASSNVDIVQDE
jgi:hypothetical protein